MQGRAALAFAVGGLLLAQPSAASIMLAGSTAIRGSFDGFVTGPPKRGHCNPCSPPATLTGWAVDPSLPGGGVPAVTVAFTIDSAPVSPPLTVVANQPRPDLVKAGLAPNPNHGFVLVLPAAVARSVSGSLLASPRCHTTRPTPSRQTHPATQDLRSCAVKKRYAHAPTDSTLPFTARMANPKRGPAAHWLWGWRWRLVDTGVRGGGCGADAVAATTPNLEPYN